MSRRYDPENVTDADRTYFEQFEGGRQMLEEHVSEEETARRQREYFESVKAAEEEQARISKEQADLAAQVTNPASTGVPENARRQMPGDTVQNTTVPAPDPTSTENVTVNPDDPASASASEPATSPASKRAGKQA